MPRQTTRAYDIGTADDDRLCGTCKYWLFASVSDPFLHKCMVFAQPLEHTKDGKSLRCNPCVANEVKA